MARANFNLTQIAEMASNDLLQAYKGTNFLLRGIDKMTLPKGVATKSFPKITARAGETRVEGGALAAVGARTTGEVTFSPAKEYLSRIAIDRIGAGNSYYDIYAASKDTVMTEIIDAMSTYLWTVAAAANTYTVGVSGTVPDIDVLGDARAQMMTNKAWSSREWIAAVGIEEMNEWTASLTFDTDGSNVESKLAGKTARYGGFQIGEDQDRSGTSDTNAINFCCHPAAIKAVFRNDYDYVAGVSDGVKVGSFMNAELGFPVFVEMRQMNNSTGGVGEEMHIFTIADIKLLDAKLCVQLLG